MLKKQSKIFALIITILVIWMLIYYDQNIIVIRKINTYLYESPNFEYVRTLELPDLWKEAKNANISQRFWFMDNGKIMPEKYSSSNSAHLFPDPKYPYDDRISNQLMFIPFDYNELSQYKTILLYNYIGDWIPHQEGSITFKHCPVNRCILTNKKENINIADAVLFDQDFSKPPHKKNESQVWIIYMLESPVNTNKFTPPDLFNWTITYRPDSDLPSPYRKWYSYGLDQKRRKPYVNYAENKTKKVAWFVSNCKSQNLRLEYAQDLKQHIEVDIFGFCGNQDCPRSKGDLCFKLLTKKYKFYLAFENSNCNYYITEKYYKNALSHNVIPIVMGARKADYENLGPKGSFIHTDDFSSPEELAKYLHQLDSNDDLYNQYFQWRGSGEFIDDKLFCRICSLLHSKYPQKYYKDINEWWRKGHICSTNN